MVRSVTDMENTEKKKSKVKNPLHRRIPRELAGD